MIEINPQHRALRIKAAALTSFENCLITSSIFSILPLNRSIVSDSRSDSSPRSLMRREHALRFPAYLILLHLPTLRRDRNGRQWPGFLVLHCHNRLRHRAPRLY